MRLHLSLLALVAPLAVLGDLRHSPRRNHHHEVAKRADPSVQLYKRFSNSRWTFYDVGGAAGACGKFNSPGEHIVALNSAQYGGGYPGPHCWKQIVMKFNGKTTTATITDECPGCPFGGLDLTRGLFGFFAPLSDGVLNGEWWFADEAPEEHKPPPPPPPPKPKPTTSRRPPPPPPTTTHHTSTHTTSTHSTESTHSFSASASSHASTSTNFASGVASGLAIPTNPIVTADKDEVQNVLAFNNLLVNFGGLIVAGAEVA